MLRPTAVLLLIGLTAGCGQQLNTTTQSSVRPMTRSAGGVDDWSMHHVKFSNPGSEADAIRNGTHDHWLRIMSDPRYQMQQAARNAQWVTLGSRRPRDRFPNPPTFRRPSDPLHRDWAYQIAPAGSGGAMGSFPAKYGFDVNATPSCFDYVVFPVVANGSATQANVVGFNNLYDGTCPNLYDGTCPSSAPSGQPFAPTVKFAYYLDTGTVYGSPVLSEDGTKVAFVASSNVVSFHVLTLGTEGNNGTSYSAPQQPFIEIKNGTATITGADNNAVDISLTISGVSDEYSSPFVDYDDDVAYVGDNGGILHKFTGVFRGTPSEVTTGGWPFTVSIADLLFSPVYDSVSQHIFVTSAYSSGSNQGLLSCVDISSGTPAFCSTPKIVIGLGVWVFDGPTVDSTAGTVFAVDLVGVSGVPYLTQATTSLSNVVQAQMGSGETYLFSGDFDNTYYSGNYASGYMYFCGSNGSFVPTLYRIGFNSSGTMNSVNDGNSYQLTNSSNDYTLCTPLTEAYNQNEGKDYLFLGVQNYASPTGCNDQVCIVSFGLGSSFPSGPAATLPLGSYYIPLSGIIIDNVSNEAGASQIYFAYRKTGSATQASQSGLN